MEYFPNSQMDNQSHNSFTLYSNSIHFQLPFARKFSVDPFDGRRNAKSISGSFCPLLRPSIHSISAHFPKSHSSILKTVVGSIRNNNDQFIVSFNTNCFGQFGQCRNGQCLLGCESLWRLHKFICEYFRFSRILQVKTYEIYILNRFYNSVFYTIL